MQQNQILDMVWAWLFGQGKSYKSYMVSGQRVESGLKRGDFDSIARSLMGPIVEEIAIAYDWDFVYDEATITTVVDTAEYELPGNADDCRNIINVRYGSGRGVVLERLNVLETDRREGYDADDTTSEDTATVYGYTLYGRSDSGHPMIQLFDTPSEAKTLTYRYRKSNLTVDSFPEEFGFVLRDYLVAQFDPKYLGVARKSLKDLIARYEPGGDEYESVRVHPTIEAGNIRRNNIGGGC